GVWLLLRNSQRYLGGAASRGPATAAGVVTTSKAPDDAEPLPAARHTAGVMLTEPAPKSAPRPLQPRPAPRESPPPLRHEPRPAPAAALKTAPSEPAELKVVAPASGPQAPGSQTIPAQGGSKIAVGRAVGVRSDSSMRKPELATTSRGDTGSSGPAATPTPTPPTPAPQRAS